MDRNALSFWFGWPYASKYCSSAVTLQSSSHSVIQFNGLNNSSRQPPECEYIVFHLCCHKNGSGTGLDDFIIYYYYQCVFIVSKNKVIITHTQNHIKYKTFQKALGFFFPNKQLLRNALPQNTYHETVIEFSNSTHLSREPYRLRKCLKPMKTFLLKAMKPQWGWGRVL